MHKDRFIELLRSTNRDGVEDLIKYLLSTDFFTAPASTKYHDNYAGGLVAHSLNVYDNLSKLNSAFNLGFDEGSLVIVALLHDVSKADFYEEYTRNVKVDDRWEQVKSYKVRDLSNRFIYGMHEQTSLFIASQFIPLTIEEQVSILSHHGGQGDQNMPIEKISEIYSKYKLPMYLHIADLMDAFKHE